MTPTAIAHNPGYSHTPQQPPCTTWLNIISKNYVNCDTRKILREWTQTFTA
jgi:hypothetical protein